MEGDTGKGVMSQDQTVNHVLEALQSSERKAGGSALGGCAGGGEQGKRSSRRLFEVAVMRAGKIRQAWIHKGNREEEEKGKEQHR